MKNYYSILGVTPDSDEAEIKSAFRTLARKYHPDVNPDGAEKFKDITEAYETLSDVKKRSRYDTINGFFKSAPKNEKKYTSSEKVNTEYQKASSDDIKKEQQTQKESPKQEPPKNKKQTKNETNKQSKNNFSKTINDILGEFGKNKKVKPEQKQGEDITEEISISVKEALEGTERTVNVVHASACPYCKGRKFINGSECTRCNGSGEKIEHKKITVKIPAKVKNGAKLRIKNEGKLGENGGKNGDLYIKINIQQSSKIKFEGNDVIFDVPITPFEAVLGGNISIPSFEGSISLKLPANTKSGQKFRIAGQGTKHNGKKGDMIVVVHIEIPSSLSDDEIKLYEKLKKMSSKDIRENLLNE